MDANTLIIINSIFCKYYLFVHLVFRGIIKQLRWLPNQWHDLKIRLAFQVDFEELSNRKSASAHNTFKNYWWSFLLEKFVVLIKMEAFYISLIERIIKEVYSKPL